MLKYPLPPSYLEPCIYIDLSLSVTCVFEGSPNDVIMAQHAKILRLLAGKGLVSSVASFHSLVTFVSLLFFVYECAWSTDGL